MQHFYLLLPFQHGVNHAINVRSVAVQQVPELPTLGRERTSLGVFLQGENRLFETQVPSPGSVGVFGVDLAV